MMNEAPKTQTPDEQLDAQALLVAGMLRLELKLSGEGLENMCKRYRERLAKKRAEINKNLGMELEKLNKLRAQTKR